MFTSLPAQAFPAWETSRGEGVVHDEIFGQRLRVLKQLATRPEAVPIVVTSVHALLQPVPTRGLLTGQTREISTGDSVDLNEIAEWLVRGGFHHTSAVQLPGEFSVRGGILDLFAADWTSIRSVSSTSPRNGAWGPWMRSNSVPCGSAKVTMRRSRTMYRPRVGCF
jgi:transcription-repair coupling factor (superfamily II helicase)